MTEKVETSLQAQQAELSSDQKFEEGEGPWTIHGVALSPGEVTNGANGRKIWTTEALKQVADTLQGKALVRDHINSTLGNIGEVTKTKFKEGVGVLFEAEVDNADLAKKVARGRLDVSARIKHLPKDELEKDDELNAYVVDGPAVGDNLAVVNDGASPSNDVRMGEAAALSAEDVKGALEGEAVLASYHEPDYDEVVSGRSWDGLNMEDFDTEDLSAIDDHFIVSDSGFPPDTFGELSFEVVDTDGALVREAVDSAWRLRGNADDEARLENILLDLNDAFDDPPIDTEESENEEDADLGETSEPGQSDESDGSSESEGNESEPDESAENESDGSSDGTESTQVDDPETARKVEVAVMQKDNSNMNFETAELEEDSLPEGVDFPDPVVVDEAELSTLQEKANRADDDFDDLREDIAELSDIKERKEELEEEVEELREKAEAVEEVKKMHAEELAEASPALEVDDFLKLDLATLRERTNALEEESEEAELENEDPDPQSEDVETEELEDEGDEVDEAEVAELEEQLEWYENRGWESQAEEVRTELNDLRGE